MITNDFYLFVSHFFLFQDQCCVLNSIVGWDSTIGKWARVEGTPSDPNPNDPFAKMDSETLFRDGKLTPSITILGKPHWMSLFYCSYIIVVCDITFSWNKLGVKA